MRIQHNIMAMSAYRNYTNNVSAMKKNLEKLSSGYKINRAGDDAAGLAISEKMRAQITGLETAQKNAKDGISLVQTAEGALTEVHDMLNRMVELASMSANGTYDNTTDRAQLQKELDQLNSEINRIADSANFNGIKLLNGEMDGQAITTTVPSQEGKFTIGGTGAGALPAVQDTPYTDLGNATVLHKGGGNNTDTTAFGVELHKLSISGDKGDTFTLKIGDATLTGTLKASAVATALTGEDVAKALAGTDTSKIDFTLADGSAYNKSEFTVGGAKFAAKAGANAYGVTFEQLTTDKTELASVAFDVSVAKGQDKGHSAPAVTTAAGTDAVPGFDAGTKGAGTAATGATSDWSTTTATLATGDKAKIAAMTNLSVGGHTVDLSGVAAGFTDGTTTIADAMTAIKTAVKTQVGTANTAAATGTANYNLVDADSIDVVADGTSGFKITFQQTPQTYNANKTAATGAKATVDFSGKTGADVMGSTVTIGDKTYQFVEAAGDVSGTNTAVTITATDTAAQLAAKLETAAKAANPTGVAAAGIAKGANAGVDDMKVTFTTTATGADAALAASKDNNDTAINVKGDYNVKTTDQSVKAATSGDRLASTFFTLTQDMTVSGAKIRFGEDEYTFTDDVKKKGDAKTVYVGDLMTNGKVTTANLATAAQRLTDVVAKSPSATYTVSQKDGKIYVTEKNDYTKADNSQKYDLTKEEGVAASLGYTVPSTTTTAKATGKSLTLQIGDTADSYNKLAVNIQDMHADKLGQKTTVNADTGVVTVEDSTTLADINIKNQDDAAKAIDVIKRAINQVSDVRGTLGATQNRLDHTINNLSVMTENIQDAESTIRDTDVADEMMAYTKNNILIQSAQAMLAQANQVPQGVLQLLQ